MFNFLFFVKIIYRNFNILTPLTSNDMKHRMRIFVNKTIIARVNDLFRSKQFQNKSHAIEFEINEIFKKKKVKT